MSYTITSKDFDLLSYSSMKWKGVGFEEQEGRFELHSDNKINYEYKNAYWFEHYHSIIFAKMFLTSIKKDYQVLFDIVNNDWVIITDYHQDT